jgi:hypothetical protein
MNYFPLISSIISAIFAILLAVQYSKRRKRHQLIWTISLVMFFVTTFLEFAAEFMYVTYPSGIGWNEPMYKLYYVLTPPMVGLMGAGCLYLLTHKPAGKYFLYYTIIVTIPLFVFGSMAPVGDALQSEVVKAGSTEIGGLAMPWYVRIFSPFLTVPGGIAIIGGAIYSFWLDKTRKYNLLIALGGLFPFFGGLRARFGNPLFFYLLETVGILLLFTGFLLSWEYVRTRDKRLTVTSKGVKL